MILHDAPGRTSIGVTDDLPKTTALLFDRVVTLKKHVCPEEIELDLLGDEPGSGGRQVEYRWIIDGDHVQLQSNDLAGAPIDLYDGPSVDKSLIIATNWLLRATSDEIRSKLGLHAVPVYQSVTTCDREFSAGDYSIIVASLQNLEIVSEDAMDWRQVIEFRKDSDARRHYRQMAHWLDGSMLGKSQAYIQEEIGLKLDAYSSALRKHGLKTVLGTFTDLLDPKVLVAATAMGAALFQLNDVLGVLAGTGLVLGTAALKVATRGIDMRTSLDESRGNLAYIFEIRKRLSRRETLK